MNLSQLEAIKTVIASDCTAHGILCAELSDEQCIQGGLAVAAGVPLDDLRGRFILEPSEYRRIEKVFGLTSIQLDYMMHFNDSQSEIPLRRRALNIYVATLVEYPTTEAEHA